MTLIMGHECKRGLSKGAISTGLRGMGKGKEIEG
jgi:hypothetical protein